MAGQVEGWEKFNHYTEHVGLTVNAHLLSGRGGILQGLHFTETMYRAYVSALMLPCPGITGTTGHGYDPVLSALDHGEALPTTASIRYACMV
jgi:hypothetical protein